MKKLWDSPEIVAAVLTVIGTLLVSIVLGFLEGRIGFEALAALFAILLLALLLYTLYRRAGRTATIGAGVAMVVVGFLLFCGYRLVRQRLATVVGGPAATPTSAVGAATATPGPVEPLQATSTPAPALEPTTDLAPVASPTAAPDLPPAAPPIIGVWEAVDTLPQEGVSFCACAAEPGVLYAGATDVVYRSADAGATWTPISQGLPNEEVVALACTAPEGTRLYAVLGPRRTLLASDDGGATWTSPGSPDLSLGGFVTWLLPAPSDPQTLYLLARASDLVMTPNGGQTWIPAVGGLPSGEHGDVSILSLAIDPQDARILYAGTGGFVGGGRGVYASTDGGQSWRPANSGMLDLRITAVAIDPSDPQTVYAGSDGGELLKSSDGGASWERLTAALAVRPYSEPREIRAIAVDPADPNRVVLLGDNSGPMGSRDGGRTWQLLGKPGGEEQPSFDATLIVPAPELVIVAALPHAGVWRYVAD